MSNAFNEYAQMYKELNDKYIAVCLELKDYKELCLKKEREIQVLKNRMRLNAPIDPTEELKIERAIKREENRSFLDRLRDFNQKKEK